MTKDIFSNDIIYISRNTYAYINIEYLDIGWKPLNCIEICFLDILHFNLYEKCLCLTTICRFSWVSQNLNFVYLSQHWPLSRKFEFLELQRNQQMAVRRQAFKCSKVVLLKSFEKINKEMLKFLENSNLSPCSFKLKLFSSARKKNPALNKEQLTIVSDDL